MFKFKIRFWRTKEDAYEAILVDGIFFVNLFWNFLLESDLSSDHVVKMSSVFIKVRILLFCAKVCVMMKWFALESLTLFQNQKLILSSCMQIDVDHIIQQILYLSLGLKKQFCVYFRYLHLVEESLWKRLSRCQIRFSLMLYLLPFQYKFWSKTLIFFTKGWKTVRSTMLLEIP